MCSIVRFKVDIFLSRLQQIRYNSCMNTIYLSKEANPQFTSYLETQGYQIISVWDSPYLDRGIASHADLIICKMGNRPNSPLFIGDPSIPKSPYPLDIPYNAACTGTYFIHHLAYSDNDLLQKAKEMGMNLIHVRQGYTKCNTIIVNENSLITSDHGIYNTLEDHADIDCLLVQSGHVCLPGYSTGFIGGATGRIGDCILFHGNLKAHPSYVQIRQFIETRGLEPVWFPEFPLTDIGSVIEA
jgi:hypothetical protein